MTRSAEVTHEPVRILIAYTGGTFGMVRGDAGLRPGTGVAEDIERIVTCSGLSEASRVTIHAREYSPVIDSADATPDHWWAVADDLARQYESFDGFVVIHGTDTMAYTAAALSFTLRGLRKPVVLTGAQVPLGQPGSDAAANLLGAVRVVAERATREVCIYFGGRLLRGNRSTKFSTNSFRAFHSPNYPELGSACGDSVHVVASRLLSPTGLEDFQIPRVGAAEVRVADVFPGMTPAYLTGVLSGTVGGVVLRCYGSGTAPVAHGEFLGALREAAARDIVMVGVSQCAYGGVSLGTYESGVALAGEGLIDGRDMTTEAAFVKLSYLLASGVDVDEVRRAIPEPIAGECRD